MLKDEPEVTTAGKDLDSLLQSTVVDTTKEVIKTIPILSIKEVTTAGTVYKRLFSLGNISCITGKQKSKKSFLNSMFASYVIKGQDQYSTLKGEMPEGKRYVVYVDTEQGEGDSIHMMRRIEKMAGDKKKFVGLNMRPLEPNTRVELIEYIFQKHKDKICLLVIDGIADLMNSINDEKEANRIVTMLMRLTYEYKCHISVVLHQNKQDNFATGWIGSQVMKKSEIIISVTKCKEGRSYASDVKCDDSRSIDFDPFVIAINKHGFPYIVDDDRGEILYDFTEPVKDEIEPLKNNTEFETVSVEQEPINENRIESAADVYGIKDAPY